MSNSNSNSILDAKFFKLKLCFVNFQYEFSPDETDQVIDYAELVKQAAHEQIENPEFREIGNRIDLQKYALPDIYLSYSEAQRLGLLDMFRAYDIARLRIDKAWLLKQDIWTIRPQLSGFGIKAVITTTPANLLDFVAAHAKFIKKSPNNCYRNTYILDPETDEANEAND